MPGSGRGSCARTSAGTCATAGWRAASASATSAEVYARGGVGAGQPFQIQTPDGQESGVGFDCRTRVTQYLQGLVGMRPMIDMNSYYVMALNRDASISVIDPKPRILPGLKIRISKFG